MTTPAIMTDTKRELTDDELTPLAYQLRYILRRVVQMAKGQANFQDVIRKTYWINHEFPVTELLDATGCPDEAALLDYMGPPRFDHLCPRCNRQTDFVMTQRGYRRDWYLCPHCQKEIN